MFDSETIHALAETQRLLLSPQAFAGEQEWRRAVAVQLRRLFAVDFAIVMRAGTRTPFVGDGVEASTLEAMAAFHAAPDAGTAPRVRYVDPELEVLQARRLRLPDPVFTRRGNEAAMGQRMEETTMFDAVCRPLGIHDFCGLFTRSPDGDFMLFLAHGRRLSPDTRLGVDAEPLLRALSPVAPAALALSRAPGAIPTLPDVTLLQRRFGLTPREAHVARAIAEGGTLKAIAASLGMSTSTARTHTESVFRKLGVRRRSAVAAALLG